MAEFAENLIKNLIERRCMNFKPTLVKMIISFVIAFVLGILTYILAGCSGCSAEGMRFLKLTSGSTTFLIVLVVVYVIWSFVEKKK
ncbi:MAG TPA: hypothetical protein VFE88_00670 [Candidatus Nanoarchaeia archaeon]|nr:hypothetical protein [Candidatus Nanoarchaeia archaeon]